MQYYLHLPSERYPLTHIDVMSENPDKSFPIPFSPPDSYVEVADVYRPEYNPATHKLAELTPQEIGGQWQRRWEVVALTPGEIESARLARVPQSCTRRQGRLALLAHGHLDDVEALIAAISDPAERRAAQIEYEADTWERSNPTVQSMWSALGGTPEQLDDLFVMAVTL